MRDENGDADYEIADGHTADSGNENEESSESEVSQVSGVQASKERLPAVTPATPAEVSRVSDGSDPPGPPHAIPTGDERPTFRVYDEGLKDGNQEFKPGVWYFDTDKDDNLIHTRVCSPLHVNAVTSDGQHHNFGRLLRLRNTLGHWREWAMPMEMLRGAGMTYGVSCSQWGWKSNLAWELGVCSPPTSRPSYPPASCGAPCKSVGARVVSYCPIR